VNRYSLGLDFGTSSARAVIVDISNGREAGCGAAPFRRGEDGVITGERDPNIARQHPADWEEALEGAVRSALERARADEGFSSSRIVGIGVDATASTPLPVRDDLLPLALDPRFSSEPDALAWLWKDHTSHGEAGEITEAARREHPEYLATCGGSYSSEWYFAKLLRALRSAPRVMEAAADWLEEGDWIAGRLTGAATPRDVKRNICAAGHKAMYHPSWGFPAIDFLSRIDARLGEWCRARLPSRAYTSDTIAGRLSPEWAARLGLSEGTPVAVAMIDAHAGAVGAGIRPGVLVRILGTSACDMLVHPESERLPDIPGISGIASGSILPGHHGLEAGQAAVGDLLKWFVREFATGNGKSYEELAGRAARLRPGESGLLALDWNNGNRSVLADPRLTGCILGQTLRTRPDEMYRALVEATAFGARTILERFEEYGVRAREVVVCGGIAGKSPFFLQVQADVLGRPIAVSRAAETCALGAAVLGAVAAARATDRGSAERRPRVEDAQAAMTGIRPERYEPDPASRAVYDEIYPLYRMLHNAFGSPGGPLRPVMRSLLEIRERIRGTGSSTGEAPPAR
jgi:L-ribulokinase